MSSPIFTPGLDAGVRLAVSTTNRKSLEEINEADLSVLARGVSMGLVGDVGFSIACAARVVVLYRHLQSTQRMYGSTAQELAKTCDDFLAKVKLDSAYEAQIKAKPLSGEDLSYLLRAAMSSEVVNAFFLRANNSSSKFLGRVVELSSEKLFAEDVRYLADTMLESVAFASNPSAQMIAKLAENKAEAQKISDAQGVRNVTGLLNLFLDNKGFSSLLGKFSVEECEDEYRRRVYVCEFAKPTAATAARSSASLLRGQTPEQEFAAGIARLMIEASGVMIYDGDCRDKDRFIIDFDGLVEEVGGFDFRPYEAPVAPSISPINTGVGAPPTLVPTGGKTHE